MCNSKGSPNPSERARARSVPPEKHSLPSSAYTISFFPSRFDFYFIPSDPFSFVFHRMPSVSIPSHPIHPKPAPPIRRYRQRVSVYHTCGTRVRPSRLLVRQGVTSGGTDSRARPPLHPAHTRSDPVRHGVEQHSVLGGTDGEERRGEERRVEERREERRGEERAALCAEVPVVRRLSGRGCSGLSGRRRGRTRTARWVVT